METEVKLTKLAQCAGCGAKVGAGTLAKLLDGIPTRSDERLLVGFDKSDDASVYKIDENTALVQTLDLCDGSRSKACLKYHVCHKRYAKRKHSGNFTRWL